MNFYEEISALTGGHIAELKVLNSDLLKLLISAAIPMKVKIEILESIKQLNK